MRIIPSCEECLYKRQAHAALQIQNETLREAFLTEIRDVLKNRAADDSSPYMVYLFNKIQKKYGISVATYQKQEYNDFVLAMENQIEAAIESSPDPLATSMKYARIGNYIDFGAMNEVDPERFLALLSGEKEDSLDDETYIHFCNKCARAKNFLLLCDNCGEIVLDKLFIRQLRKHYPHLIINVMVRGDNILNDATMEDAIYCGMDKEAIVITNGMAIAGTVPDKLGQEALQAVEQADVILSKGQGNYESFLGYKEGVFYSFLCKCDLFTSRFNVAKYTGVFMEETRN